jgi:hypothetical protein
MTDHTPRLDMETLAREMFPEQYAAITDDNPMDPALVQRVKDELARRQRETAQLEAADTEKKWAVEEWTYGGDTGAGKDKRSIWYGPDPDRRRLLYVPDKGRRYAVGYLYAVEVARVPANPADPDAPVAGATWRRGNPTYLRPQPDREWAARLQADAHARDQQVAQEQLEKRARRDPGPLDEAIEPLERLAATMTYAQRDALIAMVTRKLYRANPAGLARRDKK